MKKIFPLTAPGKAPARVVDAIKHDLRKYVKRERRKPAPEGADFWDFDCKVGREAATAVTKLLPELSAAIDAVASEGGAAVYVEILTKPGHRTPAPVAVPAPAPAQSS